MLKKILSNTIVRLILAVLIGLLVGLVVNEPVLKAVMIIKQIWRRCGLRVNTAFAYSNRLGRSKRHPSHVV